MKERQNQKSYSLVNSTAVHNLEASEIIDNLDLSEEGKKNY